MSLEGWLREAKNLGLHALLVRAIAERLIFRKATTAELWILSRLNQISLGIDHIHGSGNTNRAALWIDKDLWISHGVIRF